MKQLQRLALLVLVCLTHGGCGGGSSGTGSFETGLAPERTLATPSLSEVSDVCDRIEESTLETFESNKNGFCTFGALIWDSAFPVDQPATTPAVAQCNQRVAECLEAPIEKDPDEQCNFTAANIGSCDATAEEVEACLTDTFRAFATALNSLDCSAVDEADIDARIEPVVQQLGSLAASPSCTTVMRKCPGLSSNSVGVE